MKHKSEHNHEISSPMLYSIYGEVKKAFNADESRTLNSVAVRAAFCSVMRNTAKYTFADIGSVIGKDHSTVVYSCNMVDNGHYDNVMAFRDAVEFCTNLYKGISGSKRLKDMYNSNSYKASNAALRYKLDKQSDELNALRMNIKRAKREVSKIRESSVIANGYLRSFCATTIDIKSFDLIDELI